MGETKTVTRYSVLTIPPREIVAGIKYHLLTLRLASSVNAKSIAKTLARLKRDDVSIAVDRFDWRSIGDAERLYLLVSETKTAVKITKGVAVLSDDLTGK